MPISMIGGRSGRDNAADPARSYGLSFGVDYERSFDASVLTRIDHRFGNEGDFGRPERFSESFSIDPVQVE